MDVMQVNALYHVKSIIINLMPSVCKVVVTWLGITSCMTVARKKPLLISWEFLLSLLTKELQHSSLKKRDTASLCTGVHWSVNTEALCFKWPRVAVWLLGRSLCVPPRQPASQSGPPGFPFHFLLCALGGAQKRAPARA